jgi:hypothetical protein
MKLREYLKGDIPPERWKRLFLFSSALLIVALVLGISAWYQMFSFRSELETISTELEGLKEQENLVAQSYSDMRGQINYRMGFGDISPSFITPDDPEISALVQEITEGYSEKELWQDYGRIYQWTMRNIVYSLDSRTPLLPENMNGKLEWGGDFWRFPIETLNDRTGDCEDTALLLTSMMLNYNERRFPVWIVGIKTDGPDARAHVAVAIPCANNKLSFFDVSGHYYTPFLTIGGFGTRYVPLALKHWLAHLEDEMPGAQVYVVFSEHFYQEFSGNREFIDWARGLLR